MPAPKRRGLAPAVVGLGLLLVAGLAAGGVYIAKPSMFSGQKEVEKAPDTVATVPTAANANGSAVSNSNATPAGSAPAGSTAAQVANAEAPPKVETSRHRKCDKTDRDDKE